jgi:protein HIRA/HIR1
MNGPVFVAAIIEREDWNSAISFVGHENTIQVAVGELSCSANLDKAFNPRLFLSPGQPANRLSATCMVALGADDLSISIWRNCMHKPVAVLHEIFGRQILDLCW